MSREAPARSKSLPESASASRKAAAALSSDDLIHACLDHRDGAWDEFLRRYSNLVYSTIRKVGLPEAEREEAFQTAVFAIYRQLANLRDPERLLSWIIGISHRQAVNRIRARAHEVAVEEVTDAMLAPEDLDGPGIFVREREQLARAQIAQETLESLPERCRRLLTLLFLTDPAPDYVDVARSEGIPIGSIGPTRARCLDKARRLFEERGFSG